MVRPRPIPPKPGQESVWDYPRPTRLEPATRVARIELAGQTILRSARAYRILETSHPPVYYFPPADLTGVKLVPTARRTFCEFKGEAAYFDLELGSRRVVSAGWSYPAAGGDYAAVRDYLAFYPSKMDACFLDDERIQSQEGDFYGGWITRDIVGPFKGGQGTWGW